MNRKKIKSAKKEVLSVTFPNVKKISNLKEIKEIKNDYLIFFRFSFLSSNFKSQQNIKLLLLHFCILNGCKLKHVHNILTLFDG